MFTHQGTSQSLDLAIHSLSPTTGFLRAQSWLGAEIKHQVVELASDLIAIPSLTGSEQRISQYLEMFFSGLGWDAERINVPGTDRQNLFVSFGQPRTIFTTHCDVVPGPEALFTPQIRDGELFGRGACDVKGTLAAMIAATHILQIAGKSDFGLLVVVGEEIDGIGAKVSGRALSGHGIKYIVNGEPTEGKLALAHTGIVAVELHFRGTACHSGYPELGSDANMMAIQTAQALMRADYGSDPDLGKPVRTVGKISGGTAANQISDTASLTFSVRTVHNDTDSVLAVIQESAPEASDIRMIRVMPTGKMIAVPGFETCIVRYGTDIPHLQEGLNAEALLFGPGSIHDAHTDTEHVKVADLVESVRSYMRIYEELSRR